jgi:hypothetical protein
VQGVVWALKRRARLTVTVCTHGCVQHAPASLKWKGGLVRSREGTGTCSAGASAIATQSDYSGCCEEHTAMCVQRGRGTLASAPLSGQRGNARAAAHL